MQFSTILSRIESLSNVQSQDALVKDAIQVGLYRATMADLPYLMTDGFVTTIAPYETGTVTATNGSATITGSGTTFTAAMAGRKIRMGSENAYYRIKTFDSATQVTLEANYQGTTGSAKTYSIYKDEYRLPADLDVYKVMRQIENSIALVDIENTAFDLTSPTPSTEGAPLYSILAGSKLDTYTTGTISGTVGSSTITGTSTVWSTLEGFGKGSIIIVGSATYTVKSVESDTSLTIYENITPAFTSSSYTILLDNYIIQFDPIPNTAQNVYFKYQRIPYPLVDDQDIPDLPHQWHHILVTAGMIWAWETKDKAEAKAQEALFISQVQQMWTRIGYVSSNRSRPRTSQDDIAMRDYPLGLRLPAGYGYPIRR